MQSWVIDYVVANDSHDNSLLCKVREDVDDLYKWPTFWITSLYHCQISHVDNNITIIHNIYRGYIHVIKSNSSFHNSGWGLWSSGKGESSRRTKDRWFLNSSPTARRSSTFLSICHLWSSSGWHPPSSICRWSWPINHPRCGPWWWNGPPQGIRLCDYGRCSNDGY